jgi:crotonobetainyl-CoA:carnitine CoA-transferase CaiB-like acyl-CoA transferase
MINSALDNITILDISTMIAAPWSSTYLADYGARVIKAEHPKYGDASRKYGKMKDGQGLFWKTLNRNKEYITLNLSKDEGQEIFKELLTEVDVVIENFRPGTLERWGIGWEEMKKINPSIILLRTTGFGQEGPYSKKAGFGTVAEGMSGFSSVNGYSDTPPTLPGFALADGVCSIFGALSIMIALNERNKSKDNEGQFIDISLYEPLMRLLEPHILAYDQLKEIAPRVGNGSVSVAPRNAYKTKDGDWVALSAATQTIAEKVFKVIDREDLIKDERFCDNESRKANVQELDMIIGAWIKRRNTEEVTKKFDDAGAVIGPMYDMSQLFEDEHYKFRESFVTIKDNDFEEMKVANVTAKFSKSPGQVKHLAKDMGSDNKKIFNELLGYNQNEMEQLKSNGII